VSDNRRVQRVEKELQHIIANYLVRGFKGSLRGLVSVSRVESNPKLRTAKVYISIMGSDDDKEESLLSLQENVREIQQHINRQMRMKYVPRISIVLDTGLEKYLRVEGLLRDISHSQTSSDEE
jgi:ribosome-binding factor A